MRRLKDEIGTAYDDQVAFYVVGTSRHESIEMLEADRLENGLPWPVAYADDGMLQTLSIYSQPSKIAINGNGTITHRYGYGKGKFESWEELFDDIAAN